MKNTILLLLISTGLFSQTLTHHFNDSTVNSWNLAAHWSWDSVTSVQIDTFAVGQVAFLQSTFNLLPCGDTSVFIIEVDNNIPKNDIVVHVRFQPSSVSPNWVNIADSGTHRIVTTTSAYNIIIASYWNRIGISGGPSEYYKIDYIDYGCEDLATPPILTGVYEHRLFCNEERETWYDLRGRKLKGEPTKPGLYIQHLNRCGVISRKIVMLN